jgi:hypothetical protein
MALTHAVLSILPTSTSAFDILGDVELHLQTLEAIINRTLQDVDNRASSLVAASFAEVEAFSGGLIAGVDSTANALIAATLEDVESKVKTIIATANAEINPSVDKISALVSATLQEVEARTTAIISNINAQIIATLNAVVVSVFSLIFLVALVVIALRTRPTVGTMAGKMFYVCFLGLVGFVASQLQRVECLLLGGAFAVLVELSARSGTERLVEGKGGERVKLRAE